MSSLAADFPVLDFTKFKSDFQSFSDELFAASTKWGFFVLRGTGISSDGMFGLSRQFFDLPVQEKTSKLLNEQSIGYDGKTVTTWAASEGMTFGTNPGGILTTEHLPEWWDQHRREQVEEFKAQCYNLSIDLLSCFAVQLGLDKNYFLRYHEHREPGNNLKLIRYPPMKEQPGQGVPRLAEHTDWGSITFVFTKQGGLEIRDPHDNWLQVPVVEDGIVVNIGDALSLWTGKALKSTMHRITWEGLPKDKNRYSIAYFINPNYDAVLNPSKDPSAIAELNTELTYRDYYQLRLRLTYAIQDTKTGQQLEGDIDSSTLALVNKLNVANRGTIESHMIKA
ncbi:hypothetical protein RBB50_006498 [Rhinocladiella similis]